VNAHTATVLDRILADTRARVQARKRERPLPDGESARPTDARSLSAALSTPEIGVIAEFKRRSPSAGELRRDADLQEMLAAYAGGGAVAVSILTEEPNFGGSLDDLRAARAACELPLLRKDFVVDPYQLHEAVAAGADAVLLIVAALAPSALASLREQAYALGLEALVEVHDEREAEVALAAGAQIVGINNRDLRDFSVDVGRTERLMAALPDDVLVVSESGISGPEQLRRLHECGVRAVLVGEALMRAADPAAALRSLRPVEPPTTLHRASD
jgi:indole-3-glycerol phosphate synthase